MIRKNLQCKTVLITFKKKSSLLKCKIGRGNKRLHEMYINDYRSTVK